MGSSCTAVRIDESAAPAVRVAAADPRMAHVETIRGLTCLFVCLFHAIGDMPQHGLHVAAGSWPWMLARLLDVVNMALFTFVAGRVFWIRPDRDGAFGPVLGHKLLRLLMPFVTVTSLWLVFAAAFGKVSLHDGFDFFLHARGHLWFLQSLAWLTVVATIGFVLFPGAIAEFAAIAGVVSLVAAMTLSDGEASLLSWNAAFDLSPVYFLGLFVGARRRSGRPTFEAARSPLPYVVFGGLLGLGILLTMRQADPFEAVRGPTVFWYLTALPFVGLIAALAPRVAVLQRIARASYTIYLFHVFVMAAVRIPLLAIMPEPPLVATIVLLLVVGLAVPMALDRFIARNHVLRFLLHGVSTPRSTSKDATPADGPR